MKYKSLISGFALLLPMVALSACGSSDSSSPGSSASSKSLSSKIWETNLVPDGISCGNVQPWGAVRCSILYTVKNISKMPQTLVGYIYAISSDGAVYQYLDGDAGQNMTINPQEQMEVGASFDLPPKGIKITKLYESTSATSPHMLEIDVNTELPISN